MAGRNEAGYEFTLWRQFGNGSNLSLGYFVAFTVWLASKLYKNKETLFDLKS